MNASIDSFAIMGLRELYFLLAMPWFHMPIQWSLSIVGSIILISVVASLALSKPRSVVAGEEA